MRWTVLVSSVSRFGEISQLFKIFGKLLEYFFNIWQNFEPTLAFHDFGQMFIAVNGQILNK